MTGLLVSIIVVLVAGMIAAALWLHRSIRALRRVVDQFGAGDFSQRVPISGPGQLAALSASLDDMAAQVQERLSAALRQRNELSALLSSMTEGVLAIDPQERILEINAAGAALLRVDSGTAIGRPIQEVIRNAPLQQFVARALEEDGASHDEFVLRVPGQPRDRYLQSQSGVLRDAAGRRIGVVIVLRDVTRLRRLETVRQEFVANVSHEVKTPVSAIKAAVETLLDPQAHDPLMSRRLLEIAARQADRLMTLVEDMLSIVRLEQDPGHLLADLEIVPVRPIVFAAGETCQAKAAKRGVVLSLHGDPQVRAKVNAPLLERAVVNLIDNAIKFSPPQATVQVSAVARGDEVVIAVADHGRGIEPEHLPRVFERFYRTDRARSRDAGGTGLGLAIVKHVAEAHGGKVTVESVPGAGSVFRIHLRAA